MRNSEKLLRNLIREIHINEMRVATVKIKDSDDPTYDIDQTIFLSPGNANFLVKFLAKNDRRSKLVALPDWLETRIKRIESKLDDSAAALARMIVVQERGFDPTSGLGQIIQGFGQEVFVPSVGFNLPIPDYLRPLALAKRPGVQQQNTGRGEGLAILLFGRDKDQKEPDLVVSGTGFSVKYFEDTSRTVKTGEAFTPPPGTDAKARAMYRLLKIARKNVNTHPDFFARRQNQKNLAADQVTRINAVTIIAKFNQLVQAPDPNGKVLNVDVTKIQEDVQLASSLWDSTSFSSYPVIAVMGGKEKTGVSLTIIPPEKVLLGTLRWGGSGSSSKFSYEITAPNA